MEKIDLSGTNFDLDEVVSFLSLLFKTSNKVSIKVDGNILNIGMKDSTGRMVKKAVIPVNIKSHDTLGWYCEESELCLLPLRNGDYILKNGCGNNKQIRPLKTVF